MWVKVAQDVMGYIESGFPHIIQAVGHLGVVVSQFF